MTKITITFNGHYTSAQAQVLYLYNFVSSAWTQLDNETVATTEQTITFAATNPASYISSLGEIRLRVYTERTSNVCCYADYINFAIDTNGSADTTPPVISAVQSSGLFSSGATVSWTTNENSDSQVEYGKTTSYGSSSTLNTSLVLSHSVSLTGLTSSTLYHYRVKSRDAAGNLTASSDYTFTTTGSGTQSKSYQPTGIVVTQGTGGGGYADLYADDNIFFSENAMQNGSLFYTDWYAKTAIAESPASVTKLTITWNGHYTSPQTQGLYLYNFNTSAWNQINSQSVGTLEQTITVAITTSLSSYISSLGEIRLRTYTERTDNVCCYADYIKFAIDFSGSSSAIESPTMNAAALNGGEAKMYNNIFNPAKGEQTRVDYTIDDEGQVLIKIYNIVGELVRTLTDEDRPAGSYTDNWNGKNDDGETVASGVYLVQIEAPGIKTIKKAAVIK